MVLLISVTSWRNTWLNYGGFPKRKCWKIKRGIQLMREYLKYSALFHFFTGASLDQNQCSERAAAQASPLFLGSHECVRKRVCVRVQCRPTTPISSTVNTASPWRPHLLNRWEEHANPATLEQWPMPGRAWARPRFTFLLWRRCTVTRLEL